MSWHDVVRLAVQNLWARKARTLLNLFGVIVSCCLLLMTFAGTRGAADGMINLLNGSTQARQIFLYSWARPDTRVPESVTEIAEPMQAQRKQRLQQIKREQWVARNATRVLMTAEVLDELRRIEHVDSLVPQSPLRCEVSDGQSNVVGTTIGIDLSNPNYVGRLIAGKLPADDDPEGILLDEFTAYDLGYRSDAEIEELVGTTLKASYALGRTQMPDPSRMAHLFRALGGDVGGTDLPELAAAVAQLTQQLGETSLTPRQRELIRATIGKVATDDIQPPTESQDDNEKSSRIRKLFGENATLATRPNGQRRMQLQLAVRGVIQQPRDDESLPFLNFVPSSSHASLYMPSQQMERIHNEIDHFSGFTSAIASVDQASHLGQVVEQLEAGGFRTRSALSLVSRMQDELDQAKLAATALALLILLVAAIGISNTMVIAVLERTPEFGIMKSLGARDNQILWLVLLEGAMTGVLGAVLAIALSLLGSRLVTGVARAYIEGRIRTDFDQPVFAFAWHHCVMVFLVAIMICTLASLVPAWRAARLDPVVAMRRK